MTFCHCGRLCDEVKLNSGKVVLLCPKHKVDITAKPKRQRIGKWSGASKTPYGNYENR